MRSRFTSMLSLLLGVFHAGCLLERVTGEEIPLDPRFYAAVEEARGTADQGGDREAILLWWYKIWHEA